MGKFLVFLLVASHVYAFDWQGHRGARGLYPENTIGAMVEALKYPVTTLELDVVISKDQKVVVGHEPWMNGLICLNPQGKRIQDKKVNLYKLNYEEIMKYDCGSLPYKRFPDQKKVSVGKPLLETLLVVTEETLKKLNRQNVHYNIEIKSTPEEEKAGFQPDYKVFTDLVVTTIKKQLPHDRFTVQSFDFRVLKYLHEKYPELRTSALVEEKIQDPKVLLNQLGFTPTVYSPYFKELTDTEIKSYQALGMKVIPWTVNEVKDMEALMKMGVDGIITDYPNLISSVGVKECPPKFNLFEGKCVKVPRHALPSLLVPGWVCKPHYVQKRSACIKIKLPPHASFLPDGKTWECNQGYERYRGTCRKSAK